jgi:probable F420-dependent oxidoreductase
MRPFRFGVSAWTAASQREWAEKARRFEALGFSTLVVPDHLQECFPPLVPLVSAAEATTRLRVGPFVLNNDFRHPALVAREAAVVDLLSDGRLELGLGAGHMRSEYEQAGLPFDPASVRVERLGEATTIIKALLEGETVSFEGRYYRVAGHRSYPAPHQRPRPPILIGGNGLRLLSLAAREADIVGFTGFSPRRGGREVGVSAVGPAGLDRRVAWVRSEAGARIGGIELNALVQRVVITEDREAAAVQIAAELPGLLVEDILQTPFLLLGTVEQICDALLAHRARWGISYYVVFEPMVEALAPVVARLADS